MICNLSELLEHESELVLGQTMLQVIGADGKVYYGVIDLIDDDIVTLGLGKGAEPETFITSGRDADSFRVAIVSPYDAVGRLSRFVEASREPVSDAAE